MRDCAIYIMNIVPVTETPTGMKEKFMTEFLEISKDYITKTSLNI